MTPCGGASPAPSSASQRTALVVDSGPEINDLLDSVFASEGWSAQRVPDNETVLSLAATNPFDLIVTGRKTRGPRAPSQDPQRSPTPPAHYPHRRVDTR